MCSWLITQQMFTSYTVIAVNLGPQRPLSGEKELDTQQFKKPALGAKGGFLRKAPVVRVWWPKAWPVNLELGKRKQENLWSALVS